MKYLLRWLESSLLVTMITMVIEAIVYVPHGTKNRYITTRDRNSDAIFLN